MALPAEDVPFDGDDVIQDYIERFSNWGRWGADDQLGALNHVGPGAGHARPPASSARARSSRWACRWTSTDPSPAASGPTR